MHCTAKLWIPCFLYSLLNLYLVILWINFKYILLLLCSTMSSTFYKLLKLYVLEECSSHKLFDLQIGFFKGRKTGMATALLHVTKKGCLHMEHFTYILRSRVNIITILTSIATYYSNSNYYVALIISCYILFCIIMYVIYLYRFIYVILFLYCSMVNIVFNYDKYKT